MLKEFITTFIKKTKMEYIYIYIPSHNRSRITFERLCSISYYTHR